MPTFGEPIASCVCRVVGKKSKIGGSSLGIWNMLAYLGQPLTIITPASPHRCGRDNHWEEQKTADIGATLVCRIWEAYLPFEF